MLIELQYFYLNSSKHDSLKDRGFFLYSVLVFFFRVKEKERRKKGEKGNYSKELIGTCNVFFFFYKNSNGKTSESEVQTHILQRRST